MHGTANTSTANAAFWEQAYIDNFSNAVRARVATID